MFVAKYRKIPVTIQLSNVFWARSNNLGSLYIGEERWGARRGGGGGWGLIAVNALGMGQLLG